jgi:hypothetical protein
MRFVTRELFDLVFCLQVLEHLDRPGAFLRKLLRTGSVVIVSIPYNWPFDEESDHTNDPIDEAKLLGWAGRRWMKARIVEDDSRERLIAVFRGGEEGQAVSKQRIDFPESLEGQEWLEVLIAEIESTRLPRRKPPHPETVRACVYPDDPLRERVSGSFGAYAVRVLWNSLGFDEHRKFRWRLEHKLVQAAVFNHYTGAFPRTWGIDELVRQGFREPLIEALRSRQLFAKETLGHLSGDWGTADSSEEVLGHLLAHSPITERAESWECEAPAEPMPTDPAESWECEAPAEQHIEISGPIQEFEAPPERMPPDCAESCEFETPAVQITEGLSGARPPTRSKNESTSRELRVAETWLVQERIPIAREYRVHSFEDVVLPEMTYFRYGTSEVPENRSAVNSFVQMLLTRLPNALVGESMYAWDIALQSDGQFRVIEVNLVGFHPVFAKGFQASGFFQYHAVGPPLLAQLVRYVERSYNVSLDMASHWAVEPNKHAVFFRIFRHYMDRTTPIPLEPRLPVKLDKLSSPMPAKIDAVLIVRCKDLDRFALLRESAEQMGSAIGRFLVVTTDEEYGEVSSAVDRQSTVVPESELIPEIAENRDIPAGVRLQVAKLALISETSGDSCLDLSSDVLCVRPFSASDVIRRGKALYYRYINTVHHERYTIAEEVLGLKRSGWVHGSIPYLLCKPVVTRLIEYLDQRATETLGPSSSWRNYLLQRRGWVLGCVYFTFLEAFALEDHYYFPAEDSLYSNCVWAAEDWDDWDPEPSFAFNNESYFSVVQVGPSITADAVRRRIAPYFERETKSAMTRTEYEV